MKSGHCLCGAVSWQYSGKETWACFCHCRDCTRGNASPVVAFIGVELANFQWTGAKVAAVYQSSPGVERHFCGTCGTPMAFRADHYAGEIHLYASTLENPAQDFSPAFHVHCGSQVPWLETSDELPRHEGFLPD